MTENYWTYLSIADKISRFENIYRPPKSLIAKPTKHQIDSKHQIDLMLKQLNQMSSQPLLRQHLSSQPSNSNYNFKLSIVIGFVGFMAGVFCGRYLRK